MSYGADTDYWGFADTNVKLQSSSKEPAKSEAQCVDSNGDVSASTTYNEVITYSCTYKTCNDTAYVLYDTTTAVDFRLGKVISGKVITGIDVGTTNTDRPELTITGRSCSTADGSVQKYDPSDLEIAGTRKATPIGASADTNTRVTGSSASASVSVQELLDSQGAFACLDVYGGRVEASNDLAGCAGAVGASADTGWTLISGPSESQENTAYSTGAISVFKNLTQM